MTHIKISNHPNSPGYAGVYLLTVDGADLSQHVAAGSVEITLGATAEEPASVRVALVADLIDIDLPDAVVQAIPAPAPEFFATTVTCPACAEKAGR